MSDEEAQQAILWPSEENYPRFVEVCEGYVQPTYAGFVRVAQPMLDAMLEEGATVVKVDPDPDEMAAWCKANFGNVRSTARATYAAMVALSNDGEAPRLH